MTPGKAGGLLGEPLKGVVEAQGRSKRHPQPQLFMALLFGLLVPNVLNDGRFIQSHRRYKIASGPKVLAREIPLLSHKKSSDHNGTLPFQISHNIGYRVLRRYPHAYVNMIRSQMPFDNFYISMAG